MRTENEVIKDFKKLGYDIIENDNMCLKINIDDCVIRISKYSKEYKCYWKDRQLASVIDMQEHKLLTELFTIWGWL